MEIPASFDDVTPQWLTDALHAAGHLPHGARVASFDGERVGEGVGFVGEIRRLNLRYTGDAGTAPASLIAKLPSPLEGSRAIANLYGLYEREVRFYAALGSEVGIGTPKCYLAAGDAESGRYALLLEDLGTSGRIGDQLAGCSEAEALLAVRELAGMHATWWSSPRLETFNWMHLGADMVRAAMTFAYPNVWQPALDLFGKHISPEVREVMPGLAPRIVRLMDVISAEAPLTILHADYRLDNMFFGENGAAYKLAVFDWQSPNRGWAAYDLSYFLAGNMPSEQRRACERRMLDAYYEVLAAAGVSGYSAEQLWLDYRRSMLVYLGIFTVSGATLDLTNERAVGLMAAAFSRLSDAIINLDSLPLLPE
jgi:aminoglycoside/choline kinase family phosphotransferase